MEIYRTNSSNEDFIKLVKLLDEYLAVCDGEEHPYYARFNKIDDLRYVIVVYENDEPAGCGAIKKYSESVMEIKRMYTLPKFRGKGIASKILSELEDWAGELQYSKCILETGKKQAEAIALYKKWGYRIIPNYAQYTGMENSLCFEKVLN